MLSEFEIQALLLSLKVSGWALAIDLPLAIFVAWILSRWRFAGKTLLNAIVHAPLVLPPVVVGYVLLVLLGRQGAIGSWLAASFGIQLAFTWQGAALAAAIMAFPLMVRAIRLSFDQQDRRLDLAARSLGAGPWRRFAVISLPLAAPGLVAGSILGFARALGEFGATIVIVSNIPGVTQTLPLALYAAAQRPGAEVEAGRLAALALVIGIAALIGSEWLSRRAARLIGRSA